MRDFELSKASLRRAAELLFSHDPLDIFRLASDAVSQTPVGLDRHAADDGVDVGPDLVGAALRSLALVMDVVVDREVVGHGVSNERLVVSGRCRSNKIRHSGLIFSPEAIEKTVLYSTLHDDRLPSGA